jgi:hypothetical protein
MARTITIQVSERDYDDLLTHLAKDAPGRALVGVDKLFCPSCKAEVLGSCRNCGWEAS